MVMGGIWPRCPFPSPFLFLLSFSPPPTMNYLPHCCRSPRLRHYRLPLHSRYNAGHFNRFSFFSFFFSFYLFSSNCQLRMLCGAKCCVFNIYVVLLIYIYIYYVCYAFNICIMYVNIFNLCVMLFVYMLFLIQIEQAEREVDQGNMVNLLNPPHDPPAPSLPLFLHHHHLSTSLRQ